MRYKCIIIDDEKLARELLESHVSKLPELELLGSFNSAIEAQKILRERSIDLLLLDIEMPILKGTELYKNLKVKPQVIFTTAYRDYAVEGFELNATDYILKPITFTRFNTAIQKFLESSTPVISQESMPANHLFVRHEKKQLKLNFEDIYFIKSIKDYVQIHKKDGKILVKESLSAFHKKLDKRFLRTHRSYIVNQDHLTAYTKKDVEILRQEIPIGDNYREDLLNKLKH
ncbi:MAG: LytR/AlgR family response regulator transcription factor [Flavobacteriaceae bacterium]